MGYPGGWPIRDEPNWDQPQPAMNFPPGPPQMPSFSPQPAQPAVSDKSRVTAGVLQLVGVLGLVGFGRLYLGYVGLAIAQFIGALFAGAALSEVLGEWAIPAGPAIVGLIDGAMILTGRVRDDKDRPLK